MVTSKKTPKAKAKSKVKKTTKPKAKTVKKTTSKRGTFGGYTVNFTGRKETAEQIFGKKSMPPGGMIKKIWKFVKENELSNK